MNNIEETKLDVDHWRVACGDVSVDVQPCGYNFFGDPLFAVGEARCAYLENALALARELVSNQPGRFPSR